MTNILLKGLKKTINSSLASVGMQLTRNNDHDWSDTANFIPFRQTLEASREAGLSVGDYVDSVMNGVPGSSQNTIDMMASAGVFSNTAPTIIEIGPGTGRYLEKTLKIARPARYEIYETAGPWSTYLTERYDVVLQPTDGYTLSHTPDRSADLVHAHKVFSTVPFMVTCCYWQEMIRVIRPGGWAVFDAVTESCLGTDALRTWAKSGIRNGSFPAVMPRAVAIEHFVSGGMQLVDSFVVPMPPGTTELLLFRK